MSKNLLAVGVALIALSAPIQAQREQRRANITGGGSPDRGRCTIEVVVDGAAEIEIRGDRAFVRDLEGQEPQLRRFDCTSVMPPNPVNFRFNGVDGRGRQELIRDPRQGGVAVVRIEDKQGGAEGYKFDLAWDGNGGGFQGGPGGPGYPAGQGYPGGPDRGRMDERRDDRQRAFTTDQAVRVCQDTIRQQAASRFRGYDVQFRRTALDDNPGRGDWVVGTIDIRRGYRQAETYRFSCSVNFDNGRIRSAQIEARDNDRFMPGLNGGNPQAANQALDICRDAVQQRARRDGYDGFEFASINVDDRPGRADWILGNGRAVRNGRREPFDFSCSVNLRNGSLNSVDMNRR